MIVIMSLSVVVAVLMTLIRLYAVADTIRSYGNMSIAYEPEHALLLWVGHSEFLYANRATVLASIAKFISDVMPLLVIPMILVLFGTDNYYKDRRAGLIQVIYTKVAQFKYIISQLLYCFMVTFWGIAMFLVTQLVITLIVNRLILISILPGIADLSVLPCEFIPVVAKLSLYYASMSVTTYAISLFIRRIYVIIILIPVLISLGTSAIMTRLFGNDPQMLSFIDSGLSNPDMKYYWLFIIASWIIAVLFTVIKLLYERKHEIID